MRQYGADLRTAYALLIVALGMALPCLAQEARHGDEMPVTAGAKAPAFGPLPVFNAKEAGQSQWVFDGISRPGANCWLISFSASWCPGCMNELPLLAELHRQFGDKGLEVVTVNLDPETGNPGRLLSLLKSKGIRHPVVRDPDQRVLRKFQGRMVSLPAVYLVGPDGRVALFHEGFDPEVGPLLRASIHRMLPAPRAEGTP